jgi:hypothetical protein
MFVPRPIHPLLAIPEEEKIGSSTGRVVDNGKEREREVDVVGVNCTIIEGRIYHNDDSSWVIIPLQNKGNCPPNPPREALNRHIVFFGKVNPQP